MERSKIGAFLLHFLYICSTRANSCPSHSQQNLTCLSDLNQTISCVWNSSHAYNTINHSSTDVCKLDAERRVLRYHYNASCDLKPFDVSRPDLRSCTLLFEKTFIFLTFHKLTLTVRCTHSNHSEETIFKPSCNIKVNPPAKPNVNLTSVTWFAQVTRHFRITDYLYQLQWKQKDMSWNDPSVETKESQCREQCEAQLDPSSLIENEMYEVRVRVQASNPRSKNWSDWSPTETWVSRVGQPKPTTGWHTGVSSRGVLTLAVLALLLSGVVLFLRKKQLIYVVQSFKGSPLPDPGKSEIFQDWFTLNSTGHEDFVASKPEKSGVQTWLSSHFTGECAQSFLSSVDIVSYEVTSTVDSMKFCSPVVKMMPESPEYDSSCSSFSNPSYSELCTSPGVPTAKLQACAVDAPYKPVRGQGEEQNPEQDSNAMGRNDQEMVRLLFMGGNKNEAVVILGYGKVEKQQAERLRLHSVDSGMCSCEEVSQESMEADSINTTDGDEEGTSHKEDKDEEDKEESKTKLDFQKLFGGSRNVLGKNSIQICLDYKQIPKLQPKSPQLQGQDSGISMITEENESEEDNKPSEKTCFLFPSHSFSTQPQEPSNIHGSTPTPFLPPLHGNDILKQIAFSGNVRQFCSDGYMPVRQKES